MQCPNCGHDNPAEARFCANCGAALVAPVEPSPAEPAPGTPAVESEAAMEHAGFGIRCGAWLIDGVIVYITIIVLNILIGLGTTLGATGIVGIPALGIVMLLFPWVYYWLFTGLKGQTPGKMLVRIKVVDRQGNLPGLGCAARREIVGKFISTIVIFLGFLWVIWDQQQQGWHDKLAGTYVVKARR